MPDIPGQVQRGREFAATNRMNNLALTEAENRLAADTKLRNTLGRLPNVEPGNRNYIAQLQSQGPQGMAAAQNIQQTWQAMSAEDQAKELQKMDDIADTLQMAQENPEVYGQVVQQIYQFAPKFAEQLPQQYDPVEVDGVIRRVFGTKQRLVPAEIQNRNDLYNRLPSDDKGSLITDPEKMTPEQYAAAVEARVIPAAGTVTGKERIATDSDLGKDVADQTEREEFSKLTGSSRAKAIDAADEEIRKLETGINNLDEAYQALVDGGESGPVISKWTPTMREATLRLENAKNKLGLDVVGSVTFGALSKPELDMALATALPNLPPKELMAWIEGRKNAHRKLINYFDQQIQHLDSGGTVASFRRMMRNQEAPRETQNLEELSDDDLLDF